MTSDDQQFLDLLASVPQDIATYGGKLADYVEKHTNAIAADIRSALDQSSWFPDSLRNPSRAIPSSARFSRVPPPPQSVFEKTTAWMWRNQTTIAVVVAFAGTTAYLVHRKKKAHARKRRAKKQPNGAKKEIVVLACSTFQDPLTRSLALDLERRGYVVYVTVSSAEEDSLVQQEGKVDLRPLWMDLTSTVPNPAVDIHPNLEHIREQLFRSSASSRPSSPATAAAGTGKARQGTTLCNMQLSGVVVFPGCSGYPDGTLALLPPSDVVDTINTRLVSPLLTIQQFLPLLATYSIDPKSPSSIVIAYPSIPRSLSPPNQIPESIITSSLSSLAASLKREVVSMSANITVHELKLGNFDLGSVPGGQTPTQSTYFHGQQQQRQATDPSRSAVTHWHSSQRAAIQRTSFGQRGFIRGSSARELHNAVFDALAPPQQFKAFGVYEWQFPRRSSTVFVGSGARLYDIVGTIVPSGIVGFIMGHRRRGARPGEGESSGVWGLARPDGYHLHQPGQNLGTSIGSDSAAWEKV
ncbi:hypothetical protein DV737_g1119, partial [Chaetothyriales sp. CBS 132003]